MVPRAKDSISWVLIALAALIPAHLLSGQSPNPPRVPQPVIFPAEPAWTIPLDTPPVAPAAVDAARAYVTLSGDTIVAVSLTNGTVAWQTPLTEGRRPLVAGGRVFVPGRGGIVSLDATTGTTLWERQVEVTSAPTLAGDRLLVGSATTLMSIRATDGTSEWTADLEAPLAQPPVAGADRVYLVLADGTVVALSVLDGRPLWRRHLGDKVSPAVLAGDRLVVGTTANAFFGLQAGNGTIAWRWRVGGDGVGAGGNADVVALTALDNVLRAVERGTGNQRWKKTLPGRPAHPPEVVGDLIIVSSMAPTVRAFDVLDGDLVGTYTAPAELEGPALVPPAGSPVAMVLLTRDGRVVGLRPKPPEPEAPEGRRGRGAAPPAGVPAPGGVPVPGTPALPPAPTTPGRPPTI